MSQLTDIEARVLETPVRVLNSTRARTSVSGDSGVAPRDGVHTVRTHEAAKLANRQKNNR